MHNDLVEAGWSEQHWSRIAGTVVEEAQKARVAAQILPVSGPEEGSTLAVPNFTLSEPAAGGALGRLSIDSEPTLFLTRIAVNVHLRSHEVAEPTLSAALQMFRRAANIIARVEDALVFYGRASNGALPPLSLLNANGRGAGAAVGVGGIPAVYELSDDAHTVEGLLWTQGGRFLALQLPNEFRASQSIPPNQGLGEGVFNVIVNAIQALEGRGYYGPFACALGSALFATICTPTPSFVLPRDRILPFLEGPLLRSSILHPDDGVVISLAGVPVEIVVASEINVQYLQRSLDARYVFRVCERVALRVKDRAAIQALSQA